MTQVVRPYFVSLGLGTGSHHIVLKNRLGLCGGELEPSGARWAGWSEDGETLLLGPLSCGRCHEILVRLDEGTFAAVLMRQVTLSRRMSIEVPPPEELGFTVTQFEAKPIELTEAEIEFADKVIEGLIEEGSVPPPMPYPRPTNEQICKKIMSQSALPRLHYFDGGNPGSDLRLQAAIGQGYVPETCLLSGLVVMDGVHGGLDPCAGCAGPRDRCGGRPRKEAE